MKPRQDAMKSSTRLRNGRTPLAPLCKRPQARYAAATSGYASRSQLSNHLGSKRLNASDKPIAELIVTKKAVLQNVNFSKPVEGRLQAGALILPCAIGRSGIGRLKREGDGATPAGAWPLLFGFYRGDRAPRLAASLPLERSHPRLGWCDDADSAVYNRPVHLPFGASHETIWRDDGLYDIVIVLGHNLQPRRKRGGSAIFLHCARDDLAPTAGCVALRPADLRRLLPRLSKQCVLVVK